jgi:hypothetical protein
MIPLGLGHTSGSVRGALIAVIVALVANVSLRESILQASPCGCVLQPCSAIRG